MQCNYTKITVKQRNVKSDLRSTERRHISIQHKIQAAGINGRKTKNKQLPIKANVILQQL